MLSQNHKYKSTNDNASLVGFRLIRVRSPLLTESRLSFSFRWRRAPPKEKGSVCFFLFLWVLRCFSSPGLPYRPIDSDDSIYDFHHRWVSPFGHPRIKACLGAPRGLSHLATSFIGLLCLGIHHTLLVYDLLKHSMCFVMLTYLRLLLSFLMRASSIFKVLPMSINGIFNAGRNPIWFSGSR